MRRGTISVLQWAASSVGRAPRSQRGGREFEPPAVHHLILHGRSQFCPIFSVSASKRITLRAFMGCVYSPRLKPQQLASCERLAVAWLIRRCARCLDFCRPADSRSRPAQHCLTPDVRSASRNMSNGSQERAKALMSTTTAAPSAAMSGTWRKKSRPPTAPCDAAYRNARVKPNAYRKFNEPKACAAERWPHVAPRADTAEGSSTGAAGRHRRPGKPALRSNSAAARRSYPLAASRCPTSLVLG
jgi:hypothetical protein